MTITLTEDQDYYEWEINGQVSERFKTGELYAYLCAERADVQWSKAVWFSGGIPWHNFHTWLLVLDRIPTRDRLISWGINVDANCLLCNSMPESRNHLFFSCSFSFQLWSKVASRLEIQPQRGWEDTLNQMTALHLQKSHRLLVLTAWQATTYWLWNERNARLHSNTFRSVDSIFKLLDRQLINKVQSFRELNPRRSSQMMQRWIRFAWFVTPVVFTLATSPNITSHHIIPTISPLPLAIAGPRSHRFFSWLPDFHTISFGLF